MRLLLWMSLALFLIGSTMGHWYVFHFNFLLGVFLSCCYNFVVSDHFKGSGWYRFRHTLLSVAVLFFSVRHINRLLPFPDVYFSVAKWIGIIDFFPFTAVASFIFLVFIIHSTTVKKVLKHNLFSGLGKISYSVYLMHWLPMVIVFDHWDRIQTFFPDYWIMFITVFAGVLVTTLILAVITYRFVELPFIRLGKSLTSKMKKTFIIENERP